MCLYKPSDKNREDISRRMGEHNDWIPHVLYFGPDERRIDILMFITKIPTKIIVHGAIVYRQGTRKLCIYEDGKYKFISNLVNINSLFSASICGLSISYEDLTYLAYTAINIKPIVSSMEILLYYRDLFCTKLRYCETPARIPHRDHREALGEYYSILAGYLSIDLPTIVGGYTDITIVGEN